MVDDCGLQLYEPLVSFEPAAATSDLPPVPLQLVLRILAPLVAIVQLQLHAAGNHWTMSPALFE